ncbi:MAG: type II toxin-antitoxin system mRNA interferase toxin, RelE/StbE family [Patescibacteria group bacterium]|nr:type II toxin-antitoxin system mRNA interferase toxin, RelE/StbE family [Patescibacteria group bacterium]
MDIVYGKVFLKSVKKLPVRQQKKLADLLESLCENPFHSSLHTKQLSGELVGFYSFRITREWRVVFQFVNIYKVKLIIVGHRKDIYRKLSR